jgi:hypothetical protein
MTAPARLPTYLEFGYMKGAITENPVRINVREKTTAQTAQLVGSSTDQ